jgi:hypothetical protein
MLQAKIYKLPPGQPQAGAFLAALPFVRIVINIQKNAKYCHLYAVDSFVKS